MDEKPAESGSSLFSQLQHVLGAALALVQELAKDESFGRLLSVFRHMPMQDRPAILAILEREVLGRVLSRGTEKAVSQETHVNPNARLYVRAHNTTIDPRIFDRDEMMIADVRAMRVAGLVRGVPGIYALWKEALHEAMEHADDAMLENSEQLLRDGLEIIVEARRTQRAAESPEPPLDVATTRRS